MLESWAKLSTPPSHQEGIAKAVTGGHRKEKLADSELFARCRPSKAKKYFQSHRISKLSNSRGFLKDLEALQFDIGWDVIWGNHNLQNWLEVGLSFGSWIDKKNNAHIHL